MYIYIYIYIYIYTYMTVESFFVVEGLRKNVSHHGIGQRQKIKEKFNG